MRGFLTSIKVTLTAGVIFGLLVAAPFLAVLAGVFVSLISAWFIAKLLFMDDTKD